MTTFKKRVVFMGSSAFGLPTLHALHDQHTLLAIWTQPDRPAGRGHHLQSTPVKQWALDHALPCYQPIKLTDDDATLLKALKADVVVVVAYGLLLPPWWLNLPKYGCINVHASMLPRWRGAAPIQHAILAGDAHIGVSIMRMDEGLDTGPIFEIIGCELPCHWHTGDAMLALSTMGADLLMTILPDVHFAQPAPQNVTGITYAPKITKASAHIVWNQPADVIVNKIKAFCPTPGSFTWCNDKRLKCWSAAIDDIPHHAEPGTLLNVTQEGAWVAAATGAVQLITLQWPGKCQQPAYTLRTLPCLTTRLT
jgi:methionyl-tRNA formyltransferase